MSKFDNYKFHCSSLGEIMTDPRSGTGLSETCKGHLLECWIKEEYGRVKVDSNKYIEKGLTQEEEGITLYSRVSKKFYSKNVQLFENDFITGTPDIIDGGSVIDIKCSWSIHTFFSNVHKPLNKNYIYQINGYKNLIGCDVGKLVYVLVNTPDVLIEQEKSKLRFKLGLIDPESDSYYIMSCADIDKNSIYDDIPIDKKWIEFTVPEVDMRKVYTRVQECREFLNQLT